MKKSLLLTIAILTLIVAPKAFADTTLEGESFAYTGNGDVVSGLKYASGGQALRLYRGAVATKTQSVPASTAVTVKARRGTECGSLDPHMTVKIDGSTVISSVVGAKNLSFAAATFSVNTSVGAGSHTFTVTNDTGAAACDPGLRFDVLTLTNTGTTTAACLPSASFCATYENTWQPWDGFNGQPNGPIANFGFSYQNSHFSFASDPVVEGTRSFKATVDSSATTGGQAGQRTLGLNFPNDVAANGKTKGYQGADTWYRTHLYFPPDFDPAPSTSWNWVIEWHNWPDGPCCANISMSVVTDGADGGPSGGQRLSMRILGGGDSTHPVDNLNADSSPPGFRKTWFAGPTITRGHWYDVLVHVRWDYTNAGLVEYWLDGVKQTYNGPTLYWYADNNQNYSGASPGPGQTYWMEGYYRGSGSSTESVYHDAASIGPTPP
jgi:hypothetical protein